LPIEKVWGFEIRDGFGRIPLVNPIVNCTTDIIVGCIKKISARYDARHFFGEV